MTTARGLDDTATTPPRYAAAPDRLHTGLIACPAPASATSNRLSLMGPQIYLLLKSFSIVAAGFASIRGAIS